MTNKKAIIGLLGAAFLAAPLHCAYAQAFDTTGTPPSGAALSRLEERLNQMDQQIRALTNKVEESQNTATQLQKAQTLQSADITRRLQDLDVRVNTLGGGTAAPATTAATTTPPAAQSPAENPPPSTPAPVENKAAVLDDVSGSGSKDTPVTEAAPVTTDPKAPIATSPTVKPLGAVKTDAAGTPAPAPAVASDTAQPGTPEAAYEKAFTLLKNQKYGDAEKAFRAFIVANPKHDLAGNAQYWLGESYYGRKDYKNAAKAFAEGYQKYRHAPKAADNLLKLALSLEALGSKDDACVTLGQFKNEYKDAATSLKTKADAEIAKLACPAA